MIPIHSIGLDYLVKRGVLCGSLAFPVLYGRNLDHSFRGTSANVYQSCFGAQGCEIEV